MASKKHHNPRPEYKELGDMTHKALVRAVVSMGMPFNEVIESSDLVKGNWFLANYYTSKKDAHLIDEFDKWRHRIFKDNGKTKKKEPWLFDPRLNYGFSAEEGKNGEPDKERRIKGFSKKLVLKKKEKDTAFGIFKGTKKSLTYDCAARGISKEDTIKMVIEQFPEALEKSIKIWYSKAAKEATRLKSMRPEITKQWEQPIELKQKPKLKLKPKTEDKPKKLTLKTLKSKVVLKLKK